MKLIASYDCLTDDWYVGILHRAVVDTLIKRGVNIEVVSKQQLSSKYNVSIDYNNNLPSILSPYNLILQNTHNEKTFIHSLHDYAPILLDERTGSSHFNIVKFATSCSLTKHHIEQYKDKVHIQPSIYILENYSDYMLLDTYKSANKTNNKLFFNGLCYGTREFYKKLLSKSDLFNFIDKGNGGWMPKSKYYETLSSHFCGLSFNGAATICYRDLELAGLGVLNFREPCQLLMHNPLIEGTHYINFCDKQSISNAMYHEEQHAQLLEEIVHNIHKVTQDKSYYDYIISQGRSWYENNCNLEKNVDTIISFLEDLTILS